jgi:hypothetical protein
MGDGEIPELSALLHELAEGLQSAGHYLSAGRRIGRTDASERRLIFDSIEKALDELGRSKSAFHRLRTHLLDSASKPEKPAADEAPPMTWTGSVGRR